MGTIKKGDQVCFWLAFGQPYLAKIDAVYLDQLSEAGGATVDLTYDGGSVPHVPHDPFGQPRSFCLANDPGWPGTLAKPAEAEAAAGQTVAGSAGTAGTSKRAEPK
jgi:hypothetical protein